MKRSILAELLLIFFLLGEICIFSNAKASFGSNTLFTTRVMPATRTTAARLVKATGAEYGREEFNWEKINPRRGVYRWADPDHAINVYKRNNIKVLGLIAYSAPWASTNPGAGRNAQFYRPNMDEWRNYVGQLVRRYGYYVKAWEIWNEPNYSGFWRDAGIGEYRDLLIAAHETIKSIDPGATVVTGGLTYADEAWIDELMNDGGWEHSDAIGVHYYNDNSGPEIDNENNLRRRLINLEEQVLKPRGGKEIWITEMGWQSKFVGTVNQGKILARALAMAKSVGSMQKVFTYSLKDERDGNTFGLLTLGFRPKPAYQYVKKATETIGARGIAQTIEFDKNYFYIWNGPGGPTAMAWNPDRTNVRGFHINASGIKCFNFRNVNVGSRVIKKWNNGDIDLEFSPDPLFCKLTGYTGYSTEISDKAVAGESARADSEFDAGRTNITGSVENMFRNPAKVKVVAYKAVGDNWEKYSEVKSDSNNYNLRLNEGKYYLAIAGSGMLSAKTKPFDVLGDSDISLKTSLFNLWYVYLISLGLIIALTLLVIKYTHKKS